MAVPAQPIATAIPGCVLRPWRAADKPALLRNAMRVLEKAGFVREGVLRKSVTKDGQLIDSVLYALVV